MIMEFLLAGVTQTTREVITGLENSVRRASGICARIRRKSEKDGE